MAKVRVFIACSLDGFIAGTNDELDWLGGNGQGDAETEDTFTPFLETIGAMLMGRRTFDVVRSFGDDSWAYGDIPVRVATNRDLEAGRETVEAVGGTIEEMVAVAKGCAGDKDVYLDGGRLIRNALDAGLIDDITVTIIPIVLGAGLPLFAGLRERHQLALLGSRPLGGGLLEVRYSPK